MYIGRIVGIGEYSGQEEIDLKENTISCLYRWTCSYRVSMVTPSQFAKAIVLGELLAYCRSHEIANEGIRWHQIYTRGKRTFTFRCVCNVYLAVYQLLL